MIFGSDPKVIDPLDADIIVGIERIDDLRVTSEDVGHAHLDVTQIIGGEGLFEGLLQIEVWDDK